MTISKNAATTLVISLIVAFATGCEKSASNIPAVSQENCTNEKIKMISDAGAREKFAGECSRISTIRKTEKPKNLLEYTEQNGR
jgi:putative entry/exclusion protein trbK